MNKRMFRMVGGGFVFGFLALWLFLHLWRGQCYQVDVQEVEIGGKITVVKSVYTDFVLKVEKSCSICASQYGQGPEKNVREFAVVFPPRMLNAASQEIRQTLMSANGLEIKLKGKFKYAANPNFFEKILFDVDSVLEVNGQPVTLSDPGANL